MPGRSPSRRSTTVPVFDWDALAQFKAEGRFLDGYPDDIRTFWSPRDRVHDVLVALLSSAQHSIVLNMFGYDDAELDQLIRTKLTDENVYVQMSLDRSQFAQLQDGRTDPQGVEQRRLWQLNRHRDQARSRMPLAI